MSQSQKNIANHFNLVAPVKSQALIVRVTIQGIKSRPHAHPYYCHFSTKIDECENFNEINKTA
jgi:hypothetical protein